MYASLIGLKDAVSTLLQHGANPLLRDTNGHQGTIVDILVDFIDCLLDGVAILLLNCDGILQLRILLVLVVMKILWSS